MRNCSNCLVVFMCALFLFSVAPDAAHPSEVGLHWGRARCALMMTAAAWAMFS